MNEALLTILSALVATLIWLVKSMQSRSDAMIKQRDNEVARLITTLERAVAKFGIFKAQADEVHEQIVDDLKTSTEIQKEILRELQSMRKRLSTKQAPG